MIKSHSNNLVVSQGEDFLEPEQRADMIAEILATIASRIVYSQPSSPEEIQEPL